MVEQAQEIVSDPKLMLHRGEILSGVANRVSGDERRGIANAYGQPGTYMNRDCRLSTPYQGTGRCNLSTSVKYQDTGRSIGHVSVFMGRICVLSAYMHYERHW